MTKVEALSQSGEKTSLYSSSNNLVVAPTGDIRWEGLGDALGPGNPEEGNDDGSNTTVKLRFLTPTTLRVEGRIVQRPNFAHIVKRLRDRISALSYFYCGAALDIDFSAFGNKAEKVRTTQSSVQWFDRSRYSKRRDTRHDLSGFVGEMTFEGDLAPFLPYLRLGEYLHVGKNAVFGNGWYRVEEINGEVPHERSSAAAGSSTA